MDVVGLTSIYSSKVRGDLGVEGIGNREGIPFPANYGVRERRDLPAGSGVKPRPKFYYHLNAKEALYFIEL